MRFFRWSLFVAAIMILVSSGCGGKAYNCVYRDSEIDIDGMAGEWNSGVYWDENSSARIGFQNDSDALFLMLASSEKDFPMAILRGGLTVNFESSSGRKFGVRFPFHNGPDQRGEGGMPPDGGMPAQGEIGMERGANIPILSLDEILFIDSDGHESIITLESAQTEGFDLAMNKSDDDFILEMKIPLTGGDFGLELTADSTSIVELSMKSGEVEMERPKNENTSGGPPSGGRGGMSGGGRRPSGGSGGMPSGGGGMRGGSGAVGGMPSPEMTKIDVDMKISLAAG